MNTEVQNAPETVKFTWLHVSDWHFKSGKDEAEKSHNKALSQAIQEIPNAITQAIVDKKLPAGTKIDCIIHTGDVADSGAKPQYLAAQVALTSLAYELGVPTGNVTITPGNHDVTDEAAFYPTAQITKPDWTTYGLGWFQQDYAGLKVDFHTGSIDGMVAICGLIRSKGIGVYVLSNLDHVELRHAMMFTVFDRLLGRPARDWSTEFKTLYARLRKESADEEAKEDARRTPGTKPSLPLSAYAGTYTDPLFGTVDVSLDPSDPALHARYGGAFVGKLEHWNFDTFRARWDAKWRGNSPASFILDPNGKPAELRMMGATFRRQSEAR